MQPHPVSDTEDLANRGPDFLPPSDFLASPFDTAADIDGKSIPPQMTEPSIPLDLPATTSEDTAAHGGDGALPGPSVALLDPVADQGHQALDPVETSIPDLATGSGSINVLGTPIQETIADNASAGLHIGPLVDSVFSGTTTALFAPAASAPTPAASPDFASPTPIAFGGHGAEAP